MVDTLSSSMPIENIKASVTDLWFMRSHSFVVNNVINTFKIWKIYSISYQYELQAKDKAELERIDDKINNSKLVNVVLSYLMLLIAAAGVVAYLLE